MAVSFLWTNDIVLTAHPRRKFLKREPKIHSRTQSLIRLQINPSPKYKPRPCKPQTEGQKEQEASTPLEEPRLAWAATSSLSTTGPPGGRGQTSWAVWPQSRHVAQAALDPSDPPTSASDHLRHDLSTSPGGQSQSSGCWQTRLAGALTPWLLDGRLLPVSLSSGPRSPCICVLVPSCEDTSPRG